METPMKLDTSIAVLGAGKLGETLARGLIDAGQIDAARVTVTAAHRERPEKLAAELGVRAGTSNREAVQDAGIVIVAVKPQQVGAVLDEVRGVIAPGQLVISVAASVGTAFIESKLRGPVPVVRAMPNMPALIRRGMTAIAAGSHAREEHTKLAKSLFEAVGRSVVVDEKHMDAITGLSASGPAFIYIVIESLAEGGVKAGLPRELATQLAAQTVLGAGAMVIETGQHPALLKDQVTTPAGCTIDGILKLEEGGLRVTLIKAVVEAAERAKQLIGG
jgi:pyrroline-5-carboxylate reductase